MLTEESLKTWYESLPADVQAAIQDVLPEESSGLSDIWQKLQASEPGGYRDLFHQNPTTLEKIGRVGRIRLLAYACSSSSPYQTKAFHEIFDEDETEEGGSSAVRIMLIEDIKLFAEAVAKRVFEASTTKDMAPVQDASFDIIDGLQPG